MPAVASEPATLAPRASCCQLGKLSLQGCLCSAEEARAQLPDGIFLL